MTSKTEPRQQVEQLSPDPIRLRGLRQNNLRNIDLDLTKHTLIVVVGVSGSGKSSLVFDTIAAEAQRQINSTFSAFAQNYLPSYGRPDADRIENLSAPVVVDQQRVSGGPRSTVATFTDIGDWFRMLYSRGSTPHVGYSYAFSFNDPAGMCPRCQGLGVEKTLDVEAFLDESRSLREGPFRHPEYQPGTLAWRRYADSGLFDIDVPVGRFTARQRHLLLDAESGEVVPTGDHAIPGHYEGALVRFRRIQLAKEPASLKGEARKAYDALVAMATCGECGGTRLNAPARSAHIHGLTLPQAYAMQVSDLSERLRTWRLGPLDPIAREVVTQLERMVDLGLGYLSLDRATASLSGGEAQRIKMVRHLNSTLNDLLYIFDEPTAGLHARDVERLGRTLTTLRDKGNTVIVVEHDPAIMAIADQIVEIGPGAGVHGGRLIFQGSYDQLAASDTPTGFALRTPFAPPRTPRRPSEWLHISHADTHNLHDVSVGIPLGVLTAVTGVAGSGKSTLIHGHLPAAAPTAVLVDQTPIRGSRRSTPASWTGMLDEIRKLFARRTGHPASLFSPNSDGGCPACEGTGITFIDLGFTDPVTTRCETCRGRRFRPEALRPTLDGLSIADVFDLTIDEAVTRFAECRKLRRQLERAMDVGLGYLTLGQNLTTLSGGERQRLKLARELTGDARLLVLDEPTTGLHPIDTATLIRLLHRIVEDGRSVIVIEHDLDVIFAADYVIDMGPEGGHAGGWVQFAGTVDKLLQTTTHTGNYLRARHASR